MNFEEWGRMLMERDELEYASIFDRRGRAEEMEGVEECGGDVSVGGVVPERGGAARVCTETGGTGSGC